MKVELGEGPAEDIAHLLLDLAGHGIHRLQVLALRKPVISLEAAALTVGLRIRFLEQLEER